MNTCKYYVKDDGGCRKFTSFSSPMSSIVYCENADTCPYRKNLTNFENIRQMSIDELAKFLTSLLDGNHIHNVGCYHCFNYSINHLDPQYKGANLSKCNGCYNEGVGDDLVKWLNKEVRADEN